MMKQQQPKNTLLVQESDETLDPPLDLGLGKEPGSSKSNGEIRSNLKGVLTANKGEDPAGVPIVIFKNHMHKKSSTLQGAIPEKIYLEAAGSIYEHDPMMMRKLLERIAFTRKAPGQNDDGRFYSVGQLLEHSSRLNDDVAAVPRLVL